MKVSILIPVFNASRTLQATLESCIVQGSDVVEEIILVDDHSDDDSKQVFEAIQQNHPEFNWKWALNPKKGACSARNHAFELSTGAFIQWLDADDILGPKKLTRQLELLSTSSDSVSACPFRMFENCHVSGSIPDSRTWKLPGETNPSDWLAANHMIGTHCWLTPRKLADGNDLWDESLLVNQDGEYFARVIASCDRVLFHDDVEVYYRREGGGVSKFSPEKADSLFRSIESMARTATELEGSKRMRQMISNRWQHFIYTVYPSRPDLIEQAQEKLRALPAPTISNPNAVSPFSRLVSGTFGWKALTQARLLRARLNKA